MRESLSENKLLGPNQCGFKRGHSTKTALLLVIKERNLQLNLPKTELLVIPATSQSRHTKKKTDQYPAQICPNSCPPGLYQKFLGVLIDDQLTFKVHGDDCSVVSAFLVQHQED